MVIIGNLTRTLQRYFRKRFAVLYWPLSSLPERLQATRNDDVINPRAATRVFPIRALRYWWTRCAILREMQQRSTDTVIADVGCNRGHFKRFVGELPHLRWVGLDWRINPDALRASGYTEWHQCDFDAVLPLPDNSADIVVFLHVIEHLPRPDFTIAELARILRPGGVLLAGSPVAPALISHLRDWQLQRRLKSGAEQAGGHVNSMSCGRWRKLLDRVHMQIEMLTGTFLVRWSDNPLENRASWVRLNQLWGALFPALGGEVYLTARKPLLPRPQPASALLAPRGILIWKSAVLYACAAILLCLGAWGAWHSWLLHSSPILQLAGAHQDGNDIFYVCAHDAIEPLPSDDSIQELESYAAIIPVYTRDKARGMDAHFLVPAEALPSITQSGQGQGLTAVQTIIIKGHQFLLLSGDGHHRQEQPAGGGRRS